MRKNSDKIDDILPDIINDFYSYFKDGYEFENFLKSFLARIGLDEITVTKKSKDGGIDLIAKRNGIAEFDQADSENYYIQAKRYSPDSFIPINVIRELRGSFQNGKGMLITTGKVSEKTKEDARLADPTKPIIVVDGKDLITTCIDYEIGFVFNPVFSRSAMDEFVNDDEDNKSSNDSNYALCGDDVEIINKKISKNDVRARILRLPQIIESRIPSELKKLTIVINGKEKSLTISSARNYLAGVTSIYREHGLLRDDGSYGEAFVAWYFKEEKIHADIVQKSKSAQKKYRL